MAPKNSKGRDLLDMELEKFQFNQTILDELQDRKDEIWNKYVQHVRSLMRKDRELVKILTPVITEWINSIIPKDRNEQQQKRAG